MAYSDDLRPKILAFTLLSRSDHCRATSPERQAPFQISHYISKTSKKHKDVALFQPRSVSSFKQEG